MKVTTGKIFWLAAIVVLALLLLTLNSGYYLGAAYSGTLCGNCHVIQPSVDTWASSSHRTIECQDCHGSALTFDLSVHLDHSDRLYAGLSGAYPDRILLKDKHIDAMVKRCASCHRAEFSQWQTSGHSIRYSDVFLNKDQNARVRLNSDCLRCHGMFFERGIEDLVTPIDNSGPWEFREPNLNSRPAIPCLACHQMHRSGQPGSPPEYSRPESIFYLREAGTHSLAFFEKHEQVYLGDEQLPLPQILDDSKAVSISPDSRQRLCYQCHAPDWTAIYGTGDDRTPVGVHEGISCLGCHDLHSMDSRHSCGNCHPRMSNCGVDVEKMDTTFADPASLKNIHFVKCTDCHKPDDPRIARIGRSGNTD